MLRYDKRFPGDCCVGSGKDVNLKELDQENKADVMKLIFFHSYDVSSLIVFSKINDRNDLLLLPYKVGPCFIIIQMEWQYTMLGKYKNFRALAKCARTKVYKVSSDMGCHSNLHGRHFYCEFAVQWLLRNACYPNTVLT